ncbi:MAG: transglycosylase SLT domain-containing protein, partial [Nocardioidaceae bacterium]
APTRPWLRRLGSTVTATIAGGVLLMGASVATQATVPAGTAASGTALSGGLTLTAAASASGHRWRGHPGRSVRAYRVHRGDTATGLAVRFHAWTRELRAINHLGRHGRLYTGERILVPVVVAAERRAHHRTRHRAHHAHHQTRHRAHHAHRAHHRAHHAHRAHHRAHHRARAHQVRHPWRGTHASRAAVRRVVIRTAHRYGVTPRLALAISWQESGWQQRRTSSAGAIGAMQVMPGTGRWMSGYVGHRLDLYGLHDNVVAGVVLIKVLRAQTSWRRTVAAYYQGLGAVRRHGLYPSTRRYTRSVAALFGRLHHGWNPARRG